MITFGIIIGVVAIIGIVVAIASTFTKKFDRKIYFRRNSMGYSIWRSFVFSGLYGCNRSFWSLQ